MAQVRIEIDPAAAAEFRQAIIKKFGTTHGHMKREASHALIEYAQTILTP